MYYLYYILYVLLVLHIIYNGEFRIFNYTRNVTIKKNGRNMYVLKCATTMEKVNVNTGNEKRCETIPEMISI